MKDYIHSETPKIGDLIICKFCDKQIKVIAVYPDKFGGYYSTKKHICIDLSKDSYFKKMGVK